MNPSAPQKELDRDDQEAVERRASTSDEVPSNVTRSTQDLTIGGSEKDPDSEADAAADDEHSESNAPAEGRSTSEQAAVNQERALESGEESPG